MVVLCFASGDIVATAAVHESRSWGSILVRRHARDRSGPVRFHSGSKG